MNYLSAFRAGCRRWLPIASIFVFAACGVPASESADRSSTREYSVNYALQPDPATSTVHVTIRVRQPRDLLREMSFRVASHMTDFKADGELSIADGNLRWKPPAKGGELAWRISVSHRRGSAFDALLQSEWGIFRAEDVIPRARTRALKGAESRTTLAFDLPAGWSAISEYSAREQPIIVDRPARRFDEPTGWIAMGRLGVRRETIAGVRVAIAAPEGHDVRRMDMLALLNWTLPALMDMLPDSLDRLTIISAGKPMWRGGLSAPASLFIHADRPMISENATSSLLHEVMHTALPLRTRKGYDWITEGLAEYYSIELLRRGKAITKKRAARAITQQAKWAMEAESLCADDSSGASTALAVTLFAKLDKELARKSDGKVTLDSMLPLISGDNVDANMLNAIAERLIGSVPDTLHIDNLPGCRTIAQDSPEN